jgi:hypothetical protein
VSGSNPGAEIIQLIGERWAPLACVMARHLRVLDSAQGPAAALAPQAAQRVPRINILENGLAVDGPFHHPRVIAQDTAGSSVACKIIDRNFQCS